MMEKPKPPSGRLVLKDGFGGIHGPFCPACQSSMRRTGFLGWFGPLECINSNCVTRVQPTTDIAARIPMPAVKPPAHDVGD